MVADLAGGLLRGTSGGVRSNCRLGQFALNFSIADLQ